MNESKYSKESPSKWNTLRYIFKWNTFPICRIEVNIISLCSGGQIYILHQFARGVERKIHAQSHGKCVSSRLNIQKNNKPEKLLFEFMLLASAHMVHPFYIIHTYLCHIYCIRLRYPSDVSSHCVNLFLSSSFVYTVDVDTYKKLSARSHIAFSLIEWDSEKFSVSFSTATNVFFFFDTRLLSERFAHLVSSSIHIQPDSELTWLLCIIKFALILGQHH